MVRCEEFYKYFEKKGNFCNKSEMTVKKIEDYIGYVKRNKLIEYSGYKISNCALDPFINIEDIRDGKVHDLALKRLKSLIRKGKVMPEKVTRRMSIELINKANLDVDLRFKLDRIPNIRSRMGEYEHEINGVGYETRNTFDEFKTDIGAKNNDEALKIMLEWCIRNPDELRKIKEDINHKEDAEKELEHITVTN